MNMRWKRNIVRIVISSDTGANKYFDVKNGKFRFIEMKTKKKINKLLKAYTS